MVRGEMPRQLLPIQRLKQRHGPTPMKPAVHPVAEQVFEPAFWQLLQREHAKPAGGVWARELELSGLEVAVCAFLFIGRGIAGKA